MRKVLIPIDGSRGAMRALDYVLGQVARESVSVRLIYVHFVPPFYENPDAYLRRTENRRFADKCAKAALAPAVRKLNRAGIQHRTMMKLGDAAPEIARCGAPELRVDRDGKQRARRHQEPSSWFDRDEGDPPCDYPGDAGQVGPTH